MPSLAPFQYQLNDSVFGRGTDAVISKVDIQPYNVNNQDFQVSRTDETRFGIDTLSPGPIIFTLAIVNNEASEAMSALTGQVISDELLAGMGTDLPLLARNWKAKATRMTWGTAIPLLTADRNGIVRRIYGRPGKFAHSARINQNTNWIDVQAEFRRSDTYAYNDTEYYIGAIDPNGAGETATREDGDADAWVRFLIQGPATHPIITYGESAIELNTVIPAGVVVEVSSYPWQRRVVDSNGANLRRTVIGATKYLDQIIFPEGEEFDVSWDASGTTSDSSLFFMWREAYNVF